MSSRQPRRSWWESAQKSTRETPACFPFIKQGKRPSLKATMVCFSLSWGLVHFHFGRGGGGGGGGGGRRGGGSTGGCPYFLLLMLNCWHNSSRAFWWPQYQRNHNFRHRSL